MEIGTRVVYFDQIILAWDTLPKQAWMVPYHNIGTEDKFLKHEAFTANVAISADNGIEHITIVHGSMFSTDVAKMVPECARFGA